MVQIYIHLHVIFSSLLVYLCSTVTDAEVNKNGQTVMEVIWCFRFFFSSYVIRKEPPLPSPNPATTTVVSQQLSGSMFRYPLSKWLWPIASQGHHLVGGFMHRLIGMPYWPPGTPRGPGSEWRTNFFPEISWSKRKCAVLGDWWASVQTLLFGLANLCL